MGGVRTARLGRSPVSRYELETCSKIRAHSADADPAAAAAAAAGGAAAQEIYIVATGSVRSLRSALPTAAPETPFLSGVAPGGDGAGLPTYVHRQRGPAGRRRRRRRRRPPTRRSRLTGSHLEEMMIRCAHGERFSKRRSAFQLARAPPALAISVLAGWLRARKRWRKCIEAPKP